MRFIIAAFSIIVCTSCIAQKAVRFPAGKHNYILDVPYGYKLTTVKDDHGFKEYRMVYPDSSVIYITNDNKSGGAINTVKAEKYGDGIYLKILSSDTLNINGIKSEKYWREQKINNIVIGYLNVPPNKKEQYDQALSTIRQKK